MMDQYGNKIQPHDNSEPDQKVASDELRFMIEAFQYNRSVPVAMSIAEKLHTITENDNIFAPIENDISGILAQLEEYSAKSGSAVLCRELVCALHNLCDYHIGFKNWHDTCKYRQRSASLFESICKFSPTAQNKCCKVLESALYAEALHLCDPASKDNNAVCLDILLKEEDYFKQITEKPAVYFITGRILYRNLYFVYFFMNDDKNCLCAARDAAYYAKENYMLNKTDDNLERYLSYYTDYFLSPGYSHDDNTEQFFETYELAKEYSKRVYSQKSKRILARFDLEAVFFTE